MDWIKGLTGWLPYYCVWNGFTFLLMGFDKRRAQLRQWRIKERTLFGAAFLLGAMGVLFGMYFFRHKTQHTKFVIGIPLMLGCNLLTGYFLLMR